jgi:hypothetical protein
MKVKAFGGVFDTVDAKLMEIMVSDMDRVYKLEDFKLPGARRALKRLVKQGVIRVVDGGYAVNQTDKRVEALLMLAMAQHDDAAGTHYTDAYIRRRCAGKVTWRIVGMVA